MELLKSVRPSTQVFIFKASYALPLLEKELDWAPENMKDAHALAQNIPEIHPAFAEFTKYLTDGAHCRRGRNFADFSVPSPVVVQHRDIDVSVLYRFTMRFETQLSRRRRRRAQSEEKREIVRENHPGLAQGNANLFFLYR